MLKNILTIFFFSFLIGLFFIAIITGIHNTVFEQDLIELLFLPIWILGIISTRYIIDDCIKKYKKEKEKICKQN